MTQLQSVTCHMGSHSVTCHSTQVTRLRYAGMFSDLFIANFLQIVPVKEFIIGQYLANACKWTFMTHGAH